MVPYPKMGSNTSFQKDNAQITQDDAKYGLPKDVIFCVNCVTSNQRPSTTVEFKNKPGDKKEAIIFDDDGLCAACRFTNQKTQQTGKHAKKNFIAFAMNIASQMEVTIV